MDLPIAQVNFVTPQELLNLLRARTSFLPFHGLPDEQDLYTSLPCYHRCIGNCKRHDEVLSLLKTLDRNSVKLRCEDDIPACLSSSYAVVIDHISRSKKTAKACTCETCLIKLLLLAADVCLSRYYQLVEGRKTLSQSSNLVDFLVDKVNEYYNRDTPSVGEDSKIADGADRATMDLSEALHLGAKVKLRASIALAYHSLDSNNIAECLQTIDDTFSVMERVRTDDEDFVLFSADLLMARGISLFRLGEGGAVNALKMAMIMLINAVPSHKNSRSLTSMLVTSIKNIAVLYRDLGDLESAECFVRYALERCEAKRSSSPHSEIEFANLLLVLATIKEEQQDPLCLSQYHDFLEVRKSYHGQDHPAVAYCFNLLGLRHLAAGDFALSERYFNRSLGIYKSKLNSPTHPNIAQCLSNIGQLQFRRGDYFKAFSFQSRSVEMYSNIRINDIVIANVYVDLAHTYLALNKPGEAGDAISRAIAIYEKSLLPRRSPFDVFGLLCGSKGHPLLARAYETMKMIKSI